MRVLLLTLFAACVPAETGIDDTTVRGTVRIAPVMLGEGDDAINDKAKTARDLGVLGYALLAVDGSLSRFDVQEGTEDPGLEADRDWFQLTSALSFDLQVAIELPGAADDASARIDLYDLDDTNPQGQPKELEGGAFSGSQHAATFAFTAGTRYGLRVSGLSGAPGQPYRLLLAGAHPDQANILVGAYLGGDAATRGRPVGGTTTRAFALQDDLSYLADYEMLLIRAVDTTPQEGEPSSVTHVDEAVRSVFVFAGNWPNLNSALPAGTWYSGSPEKVDLGSPVVAVPELALDTFAPLVIGVELADAEPNDMPIDGASFALDVSDPSQAQDVGVLTGPGFVDIFRGTIDIGPGEGFIHDVDAFAFQVPVAQEMYFTLDWDDPAADIDLIVYDDVGEILDAAATADKPEVGGGEWLYEPELVYYLVVAGYLGTPGSAPAYEVKVEQVGE